MGQVFKFNQPCSFWLRASIFCLTCLVASCSSGPNYEHPKPPTIQNYDTHGAPAEKDANKIGNDQKLNTGADIPGQWWQMFKSPSLDQTIKLAIKDNANLSAANAALAAAREEIIVARSGYLPKLGATAGTQRGGGIGSGGSSTSSTIGLNAGYTFDAFGATSRLVEQQQSLADYQRYQLAAAYLTLTSNVVIEALTIASTRLQIATTIDLIADDQENLDLTQREFAAGLVARTDVLTAESQLASDQTSLPTLRQQLSVSQHALAVLVGRTSGEWQVPDFDISEFPLPAEVPLSLPSVLVRQRPDILASESQLHSASAAIGIAIAQEYPSISLTAALTRDSLANTLWNIGGSITQPIFQGGALSAQVRAAKDTFNAQEAFYHQVVLEAFGQVADDLHALEHDAERVASYHRSLRIAEESLVLQRKSYAVGKTNILQLITAERSYSQARIGSVVAELTQLEDTVQLFVALGGGWWNTSISPSD